MKTMNKAVSRMLATICIVCFVYQVSAATFTFGNAYSVGLVVTGEPASAADEVGYINTLIGLRAPSGPETIAGHDYTRTRNDFGSLPAAVADGTARDESGDTTGIDVTGYDYLLGKYDGPQGGSYVWYVGGLSELVDLPQDSYPWAVNGGGNGRALSHWSLYNATTAVPDGATTLMLLGAALTGLSLFRRNGGKA